MSEVNYYGEFLSNSGAGLSTFWSDCNLANIAVSPGSGVRVYDDFSSVEGVVDGSTATKFRYTGGLVGYMDTGASFAQLASTEGGVARLGLPTDDNLEGAVQAGGSAGSCFVMGQNNDNPLWFEARIRIQTIADSKAGVFLGLAEPGCPANSFMVDAGNDFADKDFIGFWRIEADGDKLDTVSSLAGGAIATVKADAVTLVAATFIKVGMKFDGTTVTFYANGTALADTIDVDDTNFPDDQYLMPILAAKKGEATATYYADIDWWCCVQSRS